MKRGATVQDDIAALVRDVAADVNKFFKDEPESRVRVASDSGLKGNISDFISTRVYLLDLLLRGGIPRGRITEIFGRPSGGKSTLAEHIAAEVQARGGVACVIEAENTWDDARCRALGVDLDRVLVHPGTTVESSFTFIEETVRNFETRLGERIVDVPIVFLYDSLDESLLRSEYEADTVEDRYGLTTFSKAKLIKLGVKRIVPWIARNQTAVVFLNQISASMFGEDSTGGWGFKHNASIRLRLTPGKPIETNDERVGMYTRARLDKIKVSGYRTRSMEVPLQIYDDRGFDSDLSSFEFIKKKVKDDPDVKVAGAWVTITAGGQKYQLQQRNVSEALGADPELAEHFKTIVRRNFLHDEMITVVDDVEDGDDEIPASKSRQASVPRGRRKPATSDDVDEAAEEG